MKKIVWLLFCLGFSSMAFADDATAKKLMEQGKKLFDQSKFEDAISVYQKAIDEAPNASGPFRELGRVYQQLKRYDDSIANFTEYLKRRPDAPEKAAITKTIPELRAKLPTEGRAFVTVVAPEGSTIFVVENGQPRGIGVAPVEKHPVTIGAQRLAVFAPSLAPVSLPLVLVAGKESAASILSTGEAKINNPSTDTPKPTEVKPIVKETPTTPEVKDTPQASPPAKPPAGPKVLLAIGGVGLAAGLGANIMINHDSQASVEATNRINEIQVERADPAISDAELAALNAESVTLSDTLDKLRARSTPLTIAMYSGLGVGVIAGGVGALLLSKSKKQQSAQNIIIVPTRSGALVQASF